MKVCMIIERKPATRFRYPFPLVFVLKIIFGPFCHVFRPMIKYEMNTILISKGFDFLTVRSQEHRPGKGGLEHSHIGFIAYAVIEHYFRLTVFHSRFLKEFLSIIYVPYGRKQLIE